MSNPDQHSGGLKNIIKKLEHPIEDIRVGALTSILFKLDHGVLQVGELHSERRDLITLLRALLGWFNFQTVPNQEDVLRLIVRLFEESAVACKLLIDIGGVEFMSKLRADCKTELLPQIDQILEKLFLLPDLETNEEHLPSSTVILTVVEKNEPVKDANYSPYNSDRGPNLAFQTNGEGSIDNGHAAFAASRLLQDSVDPTPTSDSLSEHSGFRLVSLEHVSISDRDVRILDSTNKSITSGDPQLIGNACNVLNDVILRDFLPEIFLQQSQILTNLLELLRRCTTQVEIQLSLKAIRCLSTFVRSLTTRVESRCDAATYNSKQGPTKEQNSGADSSESGNSRDSRPSVAGRSTSRPRGDGQDGDPPSVGVTRSRTSDTASGGEPGADRPRSRRPATAQMGIPHLCVSVYTSCSSLLQCANPKVLVATFNLLGLTCRLLGRTIWPSVIFVDPGNLSRFFVRELIECYKTLSSAALYHDAELTSQSDPGVALVIHRLSYVAVAGSLTQLLLVGEDIRSNAAPPPELRAACGRALVVLSLDLLLRETHPALHRSIVAYCRHLSEDSQLYVDASAVARAGDAMVQFLERGGDTSVLSRLKMARNAVPCLHQSGAGEFLQSFFELLSTVSAESEEGSLGRDILLSLLACGDVTLREMAHTSCLNLIRSTLGMERVVSTNSASSGGRIAFLLSVDIVAQLTNHGLDDDATNVASTAREILSVLLKSELTMSDGMWGRFLEALHPVLARLQAYTDTTTPLGTALFLLVDTRNSHWSKLDLLRANLRLLFLKDERLRASVVPRIAWFLGSEKQALYRLPPLSRINVACLAGAFATVDATIRSSGIAPDDFHRRHFEELLEVFFDTAGSNLDARLSAGRRVIFQLADAHLFDVFRERGGVSRVVDSLSHSLTTDVPGSSVQVPYSAVDLVPICVEILRYAVARDSDFGLTLSTAESLHYSLVRAALLFSENVSVKSDVATVLSLLLFGDQERENVHRNYCIAVSRKLPDRPSSYRRDLPSVDTRDPLLREHAQRFLRVSSSAARLGSTKALILSDSAALPDVDRHAIRIARRMIEPLSFFEQVGTATAHRPALVALKILFLRCSAASAGSLGDQKSPTREIIDAAMLDAAFSRFLFAQPKSNADRNLLKNVVSFLGSVLSHYRRPWQHDVLLWMYDQVCRRDGALHGVMSSSTVEPNHDNESPLGPLTKEVISFATLLLAETPYDPRVTASVELRRSLELVTVFVMRHMNSVEAPQFYNLTSLEIFLQCLVHVTARRSLAEQPAVRKDSLNVCRKLTTLLMEVVVSFHLERDSRDHSFMGRGVTVAASLCLSHLAAEMQATAAVTRGQGDWIQSWFYDHHTDESNNQLGLGWLIPLWTHTDLEVRAASLSIVVSLTRTKTCYRVVAEQMRDVAGGLWGVALSFLLDHSEASIVRERAALLLVNLTTHLLTEDVLPAGVTRWQGVIIVGSDNQTPLVGRAALLALLHRSNFMHEMRVTLQHFSLQDTFQPLVVTANRAAGTNSQAHHWSWTTITSFDFDAPDPSPVTPAATSNSDDTVSSLDFNQGLRRMATADGAEEVVSVATPTLVSALCLLLRNLNSSAAEEVMRLVKRDSLLGHLLDILESSERYTRQPENHNYSTALAYYSDIIAMLRNLIDLLSNLCQTDPLISKEFFRGRRTYHQLISLLALCPNSESPGSNEELDSMHTSVYMLLTVAVFEAAEETIFTSFVDILIEQFIVLSAVLVPALELDSSLSKRNAVLVWLSHVFAKLLLLSHSNNEADKESAAQITGMLDNRDFSFGEVASKPGSMLLTKLMALYLTIPHNIQSAEELEALECVNSSIANLIAISDSAKETAVSSKLIASVISRLNRIQAHSKLAVSLDIGRTSGITNSKDKISFIDVDLICQMNLLKNMMHRNEQAKLQANDEGLVMTISYFWSSVMLDRAKLLPSVLSMLCNFVAHCVPAAKSLTVAAVAVPMTSSSRSLLHEIQILCHQEILRGPKEADFPILELGFAILASLSLVPSCRNILAKSKILVIYLNEIVKKMYRGTNREAFSNLWLKLLINMSFKAEGQEIVAALPEIVEVLLDLIRTGQESEKEGALLVLRNLCFLPIRKSKFLHSESLITALVATAINGSNHSQKLAASALWALLSNNQKAKTTIKNDNIIHSIQDSLDALKSKGKELHQSQTRTLEILETVYILLKES